MLLIIRFIALFFVSFNFFNECSAGCSHTTESSRSYESRRSHESSDSYGSSSSTWESRSSVEESCPELYAKAKRNAHYNRFRAEYLYRRYYIPETDYSTNFNVEETALSEWNRKADVLLEYQRLVQERAKKSSGCLYGNAGHIPLEDKCEVPTEACDASAKYQSFSGVCNNLNNPNLGRGRMAYSRLLKAAYSDGISEIRKTVCGKDLPNPREMGNLIDKASKFKCHPIECSNQTNNDAGLMFSQMIAHDGSRRRVATIRGNRSHTMNCCTKTNSKPLPYHLTNPNCIGIKIPKCDPFYGRVGVSCHVYIRMQPTTDNDCKITYNHENLVSSFLDCGVIYGETDEDSAKLRGDDGLLKMDPLNILPLNEKNEYTVGDSRFGQTPLLALMHSLMCRFHNFIAKKFKVINPKWTNDQIFFETRRIVIACYQFMIYYGWLPVVLGKEEIKKRFLNCEDAYTHCGDYDENIDPTTTIEQANNCLRWFHTNIPDHVHLADKHGKLLEKVRLSDTYLNLDLLINRYNNLMSGALFKPQREGHPGYSPEVRNLFLKKKYRGKYVGNDGFLIDLMRSRDSGTAPYVDYFKLCHSVHIKHWHDLKPYFEHKHYKLLRAMYKHFRDIDLMLAILMEKRCGSLMGPTSRCIVAEQFRRYRFGDRFFYSNPKNPYPFTPEQLSEIRRFTFTKLVCMCTDLYLAPTDSFLVPSPENPTIECSKVKPFNVELFKQTEE